MAEQKWLDVDATDVERRLGAIARETGAAVDDLLMDVGLAVEGKARDKAPVDTGGLRAGMGTVGHGSEHAPPASHTGTSRTGETATTEIPPLGERPGEGEVIVYNTVRHAAKVHEDLDVHHDVGEAKYLANALEEVGEREMLERIARGLLRKVRV